MLIKLLLDRSWPARYCGTAQETESSAYNGPASAGFLLVIGVSEVLTNSSN
jgi:hypothetical protein